MRPMRPQPTTATGRGPNVGIDRRDLDLESGIRIYRGAVRITSIAAIRGIVRAYPDRGVEGTRPSFSPARSDRSGCRIRRSPARTRGRGARIIGGRRLKV